MNKKEPLPFKYPFVLVFMVAVFFFFLDLNYRSGGSIFYLPVPVILKNCLFVGVFLILTNFVLAFLLWGIECLIYLAERKFSKVKIETGAFTSFVCYFLFIYINLIYLKFYLASFTLNVKKAIPPVVILLILGIGLYFFYFHKRLKFKELKSNVEQWFGYILRGMEVWVFVTIVIFVWDGWFYPKKSNVSYKNLPHIILITCDSLSANHMSLYGYHRKTTPNIEKFAKQSYTFLRARTNANYTTYALSSVLGQYPRKGRTHSLITTLKRIGYRERYFLSFYGVNRYFHTDFTETTIVRGFEDTPIFRMLSVGKNRINLQWLSAILSEDTQFVNLFIMYDLRDFDYTKPSAHPLPLFFKYVLKRLKESQGPIFIWAHVYEPHFPYNAPAEFRTRFGNTVPDRYDGCILYLDKEFGKFLENLKKEGFYDKSILILGADHGESFGKEHAGWRGFFHGGHWLNEDVVHIPLIIHVPYQRKGKRIQTFCELVDIPPTLLDLINKPIPQWMEGESLVRYMNNPNLLSKKIKLCIPQSFFIRAHKDLRKTPSYWAVNNEDMFNAYWYKYKVGWFNIYGANPKNPKLINRLVRFQYYCIYNMFSDPHQKHNLLEDPSFNGLLDKIYNSPLVKYYREGYEYR